MKKRRNHYAGFKARVALEAVKGERTASELAAEHGVHPTMIHQWKRALLDGAAGILERGGKTVPVVDEDTVRSLHANIGELAVANDFFVAKAQALDRQVRRGMINKNHPSLSVGAKCHLLSIARSSFYYELMGETALNLDLMVKIDKPLASHGLPCKP
jgi:transposase-like protein